MNRLDFFAFSSLASLLYGNLLPQTCSLNLFNNSLCMSCKFHSLSFCYFSYKFFFCAIQKWEEILLQQLNFASRIGSSMLPPIDESELLFADVKHYYLFRVMSERNEFFFRRKRRMSGKVIFPFYYTLSAITLWIAAAGARVSRRRRR